MPRVRVLGSVVLRSGFSTSLRFISHDGIWRRVDVPSRDIREMPRGFVAKFAGGVLVV